MHLSVVFDMNFCTNYFSIPQNHSVYIKYIKTHGSESRGQEEAGLRDEPVSYLQVAPL